MRVTNIWIILAVAALWSTTALAADRPNIVLIMADDLGQESL